MKRFILAVVLAMALVASMMAIPAAADTSGVGVISGALAQVGSSAQDCSKTSAGVVSGNGIYLAGQKPAGDTNNKKFSLSVPVPKVNPLPLPETLIVLTTASGPTTGTLNLCGSVTNTLSAVAPGLGPWCGLSKGYGGVGQLKLSNGAFFNLSDVGWKASAGTVLPVTGTTEEHIDGAKTGKVGTLVGTVSARSLPGTLPAGKTSCFSAWGGTGFFVDGVFALMNGFAIDANDLPMTCKQGFHSSCLFGPKPKP